MTPFTHTARIIRARGVARRHRGWSTRCRRLDSERARLRASGLRAPSHGVLRLYRVPLFAGTSATLQDFGNFTPRSGSLRSRRPQDVHTAHFRLRACACTYRHIWAGRREHSQSHNAPSRHLLRLRRDLRGLLRGELALTLSKHVLHLRWRRGSHRSAQLGDELGRAGDSRGRRRSRGSPRGDTGRLERRGWRCI